MVRRVAHTLLELDMPVIVVTGAYADEVEAALDDLPLSIVRCDTWQLGMGESLATGVRELARMFPHASAALVCLADQPLLETATFRAMLDRHIQAPDRILSTRQGEITGPPTLFPCDSFKSLMALSGPQGARTLLKQHHSRVEWFASPEAIDVDTQDDLQRVQLMLRSRSTDIGQP